MIDEIEVKNVALIEAAALQPAEGMTVITGETGAGKTALLTACRLLMGARAERSIIREGQSEATVSGRFYLPKRTFDESDPTADDIDQMFYADMHSLHDEESEEEVECVVVRTVGADGRSRVKVDAQMASVSELARRIAPSIDLCSQHDNQMLTKPSMQRTLLDTWAGLTHSETLCAYERAFAEAREAAVALEEILESGQASSAKIEEAQFTLRQIDALDPAQEDYDELVHALKKSENAEALARVTSEAHAALSGEDGALDELNGAIVLLEEGARYDEQLASHAATLREAVYLIEDVARDVVSYCDAIELDVGALELAQERVAAYQGLLRAYGPTVPDVIRRAEEARAVLDAVENADLIEQAARKRVEEAEAALALAADQLHAARLAAAPAFGEEVTQVMTQLEMGTAVLECDVSKQSRELWGPLGPDRVEFMFRPAANMQPRPLARIASGGELSRVMLALHVVMGDHDEVDTLVFDEIDAGVGGTTALALGEVLATLAQTHQVIVVTHLAQVAAKAACHYVVKKSEDNGQAYTQIVQLTDNDRTAEIARMLSGSTTDVSLAHAAELLGYS